MILKSNYSESYDIRLCLSLGGAFSEKGVILIGVKSATVYSVESGNKKYVRITKCHDGYSRWLES